MSRQNERTKRSQLYSVFVGNLHTDVKKADVINLFSKCGEIKDCVLFNNRNSESLYGFVRYASAEECLRAIKELNGWTFKSQRLIVDIGHETMLKIKKEESKRSKKVQTVAKPDNELLPVVNHIDLVQRQVRVKEAIMSVSNGDLDHSDVIRVNRVITELDKNSFCDLIHPPMPITPRAIQAFKYRDRQRKLNDSDLLKGLYKVLNTQSSGTNVPPEAEADKPVSPSTSSEQLHKNSGMTVSSPNKAAQTGVLSQQPGQLSPSLHTGNGVSASQLGNSILGPVPQSGNGILGPAPPMAGLQMLARARFAIGRGLLPTPPMCSAYPVRPMGLSSFHNVTHSNTFPSMVNSWTQPAPTKSDDVPKPETNRCGLAADVKPGKGAAAQQQRCDDEVKHLSAKPALNKSMLAQSQHKPGLKSNCRSNIAAKQTDKLNSEKPSSDGLIQRGSIISKKPLSSTTTMLDYGRKVLNDVYDQKMKLLEQETRTCKPSNTQVPSPMVSLVNETPLTNKESQHTTLASARSGAVNYRFSKPWMTSRRKYQSAEEYFYEEDEEGWADSVNSELIASLFRQVLDSGCETSSSPSPTPLPSDNVDRDMPGVSDLSPVTSPVHQDRSESSVSDLSPLTSPQKLNSPSPVACNLSTNTESESEQKYQLPESLKNSRLAKLVEKLSKGNPSIQT